MKPDFRMKRKACAVVNGTLYACGVLQGALQDDHARSGLVMIQGFNSATKRVDLTAVSIRSAEWKSAGWHINYCPFCGESLRCDGRSESLAVAG